MSAAQPASAVRRCHDAQEISHGHRCPDSPLGVGCHGRAPREPPPSGNDAALQVLLVPSLNIQQNLCQLGTKVQTVWWSSFPVSLSVSPDKPGARPWRGQGVLEP